ncbi:MAG: tetratricopeptide repeat protein [Thermoguttaceae bacterium]
MRVLLFSLLAVAVLAGIWLFVGAIASYQESSREQERREAAQRRRHDKLADSETRLIVLGDGPQDWAKAAADLSTGIEQIHSGTNEANEAEVYCARGCARCATGEWEAAIADLTEAMRLDQTAPRPYHALNPKGATAYRSRGFAHCARDEWDQAIADLTCAIQLDPKDVHAYAFRSYAYAHQGDAEKARNDREQAANLGFTADDFTRLAEVME